LLPNDLEGVKACFSPGVNNRKTFEDELSAQHSIHCYMCDFTSDSDKLSTPLIPGYQIFDKKWLDIDGSPDSFSLQQWIDLYAPDSSHDLLLQIDIEGAEYRNLNSATEATLQRFRIIIIELHGLHALLDSSQAEVELAPLLRKLDKTHVCVHAHPNNCCGEVVDPESGRNIPVVIELSFLRRDRFDLDRGSSELSMPYMPHPLDISCNMPDRAPLHMNHNWLHRGASGLESQFKKADDNLEFMTYLWEGKRHEFFSNLLLSEGSLQASLLNLYQIACGLELDGELVSAQPSVFGHEEIANGKIFRLGDNYPGYPRVGLVHDQEPFFFHTALGLDQYITIDLLDSTMLAWLVLKNRTDCLGDRAKHLFYSVHEDINLSGRLLPVLTPNDFLYTAYGLSVTPLLDQVGRYLTLYSPALSAIHLSSLRIYSSKHG
jgi:hypothetical protein